MTRAIRVKLVLHDDLDAAAEGANMLRQAADRIGDVLAAEKRGDWVLATLTDSKGREAGYVVPDDVGNRADE